MRTKSPGGAKGWRWAHEKAASRADTARRLARESTSSADSSRNSSSADLLHINKLASLKVCARSFPRGFERLAVLRAKPPGQLEELGGGGYVIAAAIFHRIPQKN